MEQKLAKTSFFVVTNLATAMILETADMSDKIGNISSKKDILKPIGPIPVAIKKSVGNAAYMTKNVELKQRKSADKFNAHPCTAICQTIIPSMREVYLRVRKKD